jgi:hypothetical protein
LENENNLDRLLNDVYKDEIKNGGEPKVSIRNSTGEKT